MSAEEKAERIQRELFKNLVGEITDQELIIIKQELKTKEMGGFKAGEIQRELRTMDDILEKLKRRGLIKIGDYRILRKLFIAISSDEPMKYIEKAENLLFAMNWPVKRVDLDAAHQETGHMGMHGTPSYPHQTAVHHPSPYYHQPPQSHPSHYGHSQMGPPTQPAPRGYPSGHSSWNATHSQMMMQASPQQHSPVTSSDGGPTALPQPPHTRHFSPSVADVQKMESPSPKDDDVFSPPRNIHFDTLTEYEPGRGYVLFVNNFFIGKSDQRRGAEVDERSVRNLFQKVLKDFYLHYAKDVGSRELHGYLSSLKNTLSSGEYKSFVLILGTHGEAKKDGEDGPRKDAVLMADNEWILTEEIMSNFYGDQIPAMKDKPKIFIIQSCRGKEKQRYVSLSDTPATVSNPSVSDYPPVPPPATRPVNSDVLIAYATSEGTRAWRNEDEGSWFVRDLCDAIEVYHNKEHILDILVRVNARMVLREATVDRAKQMPCFVCTFTRKYFLSPPINSYTS